MPLKIASKEKHEWAFHDARSGADIVFYYRNPTMQEHVAWRSAVWGQSEKPITERLFMAGLEYGKGILTGYRPGDIEFPDCDEVPENWVDRVAAERPEIIADFANAVFGAIQTGGPANEIPFEKSSTG